MADNNKGVGHGVTASLSHVNLSANNPPLLHNIAIITVASNCCFSCLGGACCGKRISATSCKVGTRPIAFYWRQDLRRHDSLDIQ